MNKTAEERYASLLMTEYLRVQLRMAFPDGVQPKDENVLLHLEALVSQGNIVKIGLDAEGDYMTTVCSGTELSSKEVCGFGTSILESVVDVLHRCEDGDWET